MWPLDVSIGALAGLVLYLSVTQLKFDDPRWMYNAWTYAIGIPVVAMLLAVSSHSMVSRYVHRSIQLGLLFSLLVHLLLLILAVNVIIFSRYFPEAFTGMRPDRAVERKTLPEYLFQPSRQSKTTPDWAKPVEAETSSRVIPEERRKLPPVEQAAPKVEAPRPRETQQDPIKKYLMKRSEPAEAPPMPTDSPAELARREFQSPTNPFNADAPVAPDVPAEAEPTRPSAERDLASQQRQPPPTSTSLPEPTPSQTELDVPARPSLAGARTREIELPTVGESGLRNERRQRQRDRIPPAGSAPAPQSVPIARVDESANRTLAPVDVPLSRQGRAQGAQLAMGNRLQTGMPIEGGSPLAAPLASNQVSARSGVPEITGGLARRAPGRTTRLNLGSGMSPAGTPRFQASGNPARAESAAAAAASDRLATQSSTSRTEQQERGTSVPSMSSPGPILDLPLEVGPMGLSVQPRPRPIAGIAVAEDLPRVGALDFARSTRPRREVGGPVTPFGSKIASVESFNRRVLRTQGGSAPAGAGLVTPATEEAIERGLAYLENVQNEDGSWSLQGHGLSLIHI